MTTTVNLVWFRAGGGHLAAAQALQQVLAAQGARWCVRKLNLTEVLDPGGLFKRVMGFEPEDLYNRRLASGFTLGLTQELKLLQGLIRVSHAGLVQRLARHWRSTQPDLVVSLVPNFNRAMHDALALARPGAPFVTVMTDMADHPPSFWIEPTTSQHVVCGTGHAVRQALAAGCAPWRVHRASGMILRPDFYGPAWPEHATECANERANERTDERAADRRGVGLDADTPTGLVLFGGTGSRVMTRIAQALPATPLVLMCGRNEALAETLRALPAAAPRIVVGHTPEVARWMRRADFFIGKPGPGSLSEAVHCGLPVIVTRNAFTMPQERWNTVWVREQGLGLVVRSHADIGAAVRALLPRLPEFQARLRAIDNRAVFELPDILHGIALQAERVASPA